MALTEPLVPAPILCFIESAIPELSPRMGVSFIMWKPLYCCGCMPGIPLVIP